MNASDALRRDIKEVDGSSSLSSAEFARRFEAATSILWTVAAGVVNDPSLAEDVLQEAALIGLSKLAEFEPGTHFNAWMARIVRNVGLNHVRLVARRRTRREDPATLDEASPAREPSPQIDAPAALDAAAGHFDDELSTALAELSPVARACLLLKVVVGLEYKEIARTLAVPEGTAMSHVHRARRALRDKLTAEDRPGAVKGR